MTKPAKSYHRKVLLINPPFQFRFMAWMGSLSVAVIMVMHLAHVWFFHNLREQARLAGLAPDHVFFRFIEDRQVEMSTITGVTFFVLLVLVVSVGLVLSHKIAGPMYRLKTHFTYAAETGVVKPVHFREGDYFQEVPEAYNLQFKKQEESTEKKAV